MNVFFLLENSESLNKQKFVIFIYVYEQYEKRRLSFIHFRRKISTNGNLKIRIDESNFNQLFKTKPRTVF
jgi:hypothetical protein